MAPATEIINTHLHAYLTAHSTPPDRLLEDLASETARLYPSSTGLQISPEQGTFMTLLAQLSTVRDAVEIGTFTGYSSVCIARGLLPGGTLLTCDVSEEWVSVAQRYWERAGLSDTVTSRLGPALDTLAELPEEPRFDLAFVDADKEHYIDYWEALLPRLRPGGALLVDNALAVSQGSVTDDPLPTPALQCIRDFNDHAASDGRVDVVVVPIGDGLTLARKHA